MPHQLSLKALQLLQRLPLLRCLLLRVSPSLRAQWMCSLLFPAHPGRGAEAMEDGSAAFTESDEKGGARTVGVVPLPTVMWSRGVPLQVDAVRSCPHLERLDPPLTIYGNHYDHQATFHSTVTALIGADGAPALSAVQHLHLNAGYVLAERHARPPPAALHLLRSALRLHLSVSHLQWAKADLVVAVGCSLRLLAAAHAPAGMCLRTVSNSTCGLPAPPTPTAWLLACRTSAHSRVATVRCRNGYGSRCWIIHRTSPASRWTASSARRRGRTGLG